jgi:hypothetical protein
MSFWQGGLRKGERYAFKAIKQNYFDYGLSIATLIPLHGYYPTGRFPTTDKHGWFTASHSHRTTQGRQDKLRAA